MQINQETDVKEKETRQKKKTNTNKSIKSGAESALSKHNESNNAAYLGENPKTPDLNSIDKYSQEYTDGLTSAMINYSGGLNFFEVPCYLSTVSEAHDPTSPPPYKYIY